MTAKETLVTARKLIDKPQKWMRGEYTNGKGRYSASGAILHTLWDKEEEGDDYMRAAFAEHPAGNALRRVVPAKYERLDDFNDDVTHAEVLEAFDKAIKQLSR